MTCKPIFLAGSMAAALTAIISTRAHAGGFHFPAGGSASQSMSALRSVSPLKTGKSSSDKTNSFSTSHSAGVIAAANGNTGFSGIGLPQTGNNAKVIAAPNGNTGISGIGLPQSQKNTRVIAAPNGNTGITGAGVPAGTVFTHAAGGGANISPAALKPQKTMSFDLSDLAGAAINPIGTGTTAVLNAAGDVAYGITHMGSHPLPQDEPAPDGPVFQGSISATAIPPGSLKDKAIGPLHPGDANASSKVAVGLSKSSVGGLATPIGSGIPQTPSGVGGSAGSGNDGSHTGNKPGNQSHDLSTHPVPHTPPVGQSIPIGLGGIGGGSFPLPLGGGSISLPEVGPAEPAIQQVAFAQPAPVAADAQAAQQPAAAVDLVLEDVQYVEPATMFVGPAYRVKFRNQSRQVLGAFAVAIFAGVDGKLAESAPRAVVEVAGLAAGEASEVTLRLPAAAMKLVSSDAGRPVGFSHLFVAIDATNAIAEVDETNNLAIVDRAALEPSAQQ
jgi:hypothetical protein